MYLANFARKKIPLKKVLFLFNSSKKDSKDSSMIFSFNMAVQTATTTAIFPTSLSLVKKNTNVFSLSPATI